MEKNVYKKPEDEAAAGQPVVQAPEEQDAAVVNPGQDAVAGSQNRPQTEKPKKKKKKKKLLSFIIWVVVIAVIVFLTLFLASKIGKFDSIPDMLQWIRGQF